MGEVSAVGAVGDAKNVKHVKHVDATAGTGARAAGEVNAMETAGTAGGVGTRAAAGGAPRAGGRAGTRGVRVPSGAGAAAPPVPVVLAGARGHGRRHLDNLRRLTRSGAVRLAGICDLLPPPAADLAHLGDPRHGTDLGELIERTGAAVVIVCTPIHTHADLALTAVRHGAHVLLEKPPAPSLAEFERLAAGVAAAGRACQVGFQSLGSHAVPRVRRLIEDGAIGAVHGIGAAGNWAREEHYFTRSPWAGRRTLEGAAVVDGVLTNPLAHALATALHLDGSRHAGDVSSVETELFRANDIESDDTSCVRLRTARGTPVTVAATLCARTPAEPYVVVHGARGRITLWYRQDRVLLQRAGHGPEEHVHGRTDLLENLLAHRAHGRELLVPLSATGSFMQVVEAVRTAPEPVPVPASLWRTAKGERSHRRIVRGVDDLVAAAAERLQTFSELGAPWAAAPAREAGR